MTTLNDIYILQRVAEKAAEKYNRRCRRLVALYRAGRKVDARHWDYTDCMRLMAESTARDLETVIEQQAQIAATEPAINN
ncbi:hypothetical protein [uncultured Fibrobacter sp.]|uniref:hypothetical protein n=1 Tax=uncultured Fibrobacter sp. TaxID=261512 RepID=UPI001B0F06A5|nr:hypothetical protein [uncultured Fibrobacter sp.]MBO7104239.1 hypothetical protein [Fibrobacter sp.]